MATPGVILEEEPDIVRVRYNDSRGYTADDWWPRAMWSRRDRGLARDFS